MNSKHFSQRIRKKPSKIITCSFYDSHFKDFFKVPNIKFSHKAVHHFSYPLLGEPALLGCSEHNGESYTLLCMSYCDLDIKFQLYLFFFSF